MFSVRPRALFSAFALLIVSQTWSSPVVQAQVGTYSASVLGDSPSVFYRLGEAAAGVMTDSSGNGRNGVLGASSFGVAGALVADPNTAVGVSGSAGVYASGAGLPIGAAPRSVEAWFKTGWTNTAQDIVSYGSAIDGQAFGLLLLTPTRIGVNGQSAAYTKTVTVASSLADNNWHHFVATYDGGVTISVYVDGLLAGAVAMPSALNTVLVPGQGLRVGAFANNCCNASVGAVDEVAVYPSVLTESKVLSHFNASGITLPSAPAVSAVAGPNSAIVSWSSAVASVPSGQVPVSGYLVTAFLGAAPQNSVAVPVTANSVTISGLQGGVSYSMRVIATNVYRPGPAGVSAVVVPTGTAVTYASAVLADGPSVFYRLGESGSGVMADSSGNGRNGILGAFGYGASGALIGDSNTAVAVSGTTALYGSGAGLPVGNTARSVEAWVRTGGTGASQDVVSYGTAADGQAFGLLLLYANQVGLNGYSDTYTKTFVTNSSVMDTFWHHYVLTYDGVSIVSVYVDGLFVGSGSLPGPLNTVLVPTQGLRIGAFINNCCNYTGGYVDDVAVYNFALSAARVRAHYEASGRALVTAKMTAFLVNSMGQITKSTVRAPLSADPVSMTTGAMTHESTDLSVPGRGVGYRLLRSYDSKVTSTGPLGVGWGHAFDEKLSVDAVGVVTWSNGTGAEIVYQPDGSGGFVTPSGVLGRLAVVAGLRELNTQDQLTHRFGADGKLTKILDRSGQGLTMAYDASGRLSTVTDASNRIATYTYGTVGAALGRLVSVAIGGRAVSFAYITANAKVLLNSSTDVRGKISTYTYDANGFLTSVVDPLSHAEFTNIYDSTGRVVSQADQLGKISTFVWDDVNQKSTMTDAAGAVRSWGFAGNVLTSTVDPAGTTSVANNAVLDTTGFTDADGKVWAATYDVRGNMLTRTAPAPLSYVESWTYDLRNNPLTYVDPRGITTTYTYDTAGRVASVSRPAPTGNAVTGYVWNADGTLASTTDPRGAVTSFVYEANGNMLSSTDQLGNKTSYTYDTAGRVLTVVEPRGNVVGATAAQFTTTYTYDANGNVLTVKDALARVTTNVYDNAGNLSSTTAPDTGATTFAYNAANELISQTAPDGGVTSYDYSNRGERVKQTDPTGGITTWTYDGAGRMATMVEPRGNVVGANAALYTTTYGYDALGRQTSVTDPIGRVTTTAYDVLGRVSSRTDPQGTSTYTYDGNGNQLSVVRTGVGTSSTTFDSLDRVATSTDPRGKTSTYAYDLGGNLTSMTTPLGFVTKHTYDLIGRRQTTVDPRGNVVGGVPANFTTTFEYDAASNQIGVTNQLGEKTVTTFSRTGTVASVRDPKLNTTTFTYDPVDRIKTVVAPLQGTTTYAYNTTGRLTSRTDSKTHVTGYVYDLAGRLKKQTDPLGRFRTYDYDVAGFQTKMTNARANAAANPVLGSTTMTYDSVGRSTLRDYSDATPDVSYTYDTIGRVASMTDGAGTESYGYDTAGRLTTVTRGTATYTYGYDNNGNVVSRTYPDGTVTTYGFDDDNRLTTVTTGTKVTTYSYDAAGNVIGTALPNGVTRTAGFDRAGRVSTIGSTLGATPFAGYTFTRDANGLPTLITATGTNVAGTRQFTYDTANRLTSVCYAAGVCPAASKTTWTYDTVGNRATEKIGAAAATTYTYDNADQLINAVVGTATTATYGYDADGNQTTAGPRVSTFNAAAQTVSIQDGASPVTTYSYDGAGKRLTAVNGAVTSRFSWDSNSSLPILAIESDTAGTQVRKYTYGIEPISVTTPTATSYYVTDEIGSTTHVTSSAGATQWAYTYTPFGTTKTGVKVDPLAPNNPMKFTGQYEDPTGNYNLRARLYNPGLGIFTQSDPLQADIGAAYPSAYVYGHNNPAMYVDPSGLRGQAACGNPGVVGSLNLFADSVFDALPFVSVGSSACENSQLTQMFVVGATDWVPTAEVVAKVAAVAATGGAAAAALPAITVTLPTIGFTGFGTVGMVGATTSVVVPQAVGVGAGVAGGVATFAKRPSRQGDNASRNNRVQNDQFREAIRRANAKLGRTLNRTEQQMVHRAISHQNYTLDEIVDVAVGMFT
jgi:RHS repeat-associated protein